MEAFHLYIAIFVCILLIVAVIGFSLWQASKMKQFVKDELTKFSTLVNDAQYNEFVYDKLQEENIKNMDERLKELEPNESA